MLITEFFSAHIRCFVFWEQYSSLLGKKSVSSKPFISKANIYSVIPLVVVNVFFQYHVYQVADNSQFSFTAIISYMTFFLCNILYSLLNFSKINLVKYITVQACSIARLILYANRCVKLIRRGSQNEERKDFDLLIMATQISIYVFYIQQMRKAWHNQKEAEIIFKKNYQSLMTNSEK